MWKAPARPNASQHIIQAIPAPEILRSVELWIRKRMESRTFCCATERFPPLRLARLMDFLIYNYLNLSIYTIKYWEICTAELLTQISIYTREKYVLLSEMAWPILLQRLLFSPSNRSTSQSFIPPINMYTSLLAAKLLSARGWMEERMNRCRQCEYLLEFSSVLVI